MTREELEHIIRASADIYPLHAPELADQIDGGIGEGSSFHATHGYYAQGVGPDTATLPEGWLGRVCRVQNENTNGVVGYCLDLPDLFMSKAWAGRDKDRDFCGAMLVHGYVALDEVLELVEHMPLEGKGQTLLRARIRRWAKAAEVT